LLTQGVAGISFVLSAALIASPLMVLKLRQRPYYQQDWLPRGRHVRVGRTQTWGIVIPHDNARGACADTLKAMTLRLV